MEAKTWHRGKQEDKGTTKRRKIKTRKKMYIQDKIRQNKERKRRKYIRGSWRKGKENVRK